MTNFLYNPDRKGKQQLIAEFVVRTNILDEIMQDIESSDMKTPEQHYLLVGQRGTGKTTLLHRIKYAIEDSGKLNEWLIPVIFSEEQYNISELANLWENVCHYLEDYYGFSNLYTEVETHFNKANFEEISYEILEKHLRKRSKKLVLLIDNIGDLLQKLEDKEIRRLRELLQTRFHVRVIAASPFYLDNVLDYKQPLFEFFKVKRLDGLNREETTNLLLKLGEVNNEKEKIERILRDTSERVETLRILTGGVPRTMAMMFKIFVDHEHENSVKDMERILDAVTPLYKHRMDDLPKQQQKIVDAVARSWDAISVKELKDRIRLDSKIISAQLNQLEKNQVIEKRISKTKNHLYLIKERFWNIWYLMRYGRKFDRERVIWLVKFMECWFNSNELTQRVTDFIQKVKKRELPESTIELFGLAYSSLENIEMELRMDLRDSLPIEIANSVSIKNKEVIDAVVNLVNEEKYEEAVNLIRKIKNFDGRTKLKAMWILAEIPNSIFAVYYTDRYEGKTEELTKTDVALFFLNSVNTVLALVFHKEYKIEDQEVYELITREFDFIKAYLKRIVRNSPFDFKLVDMMLGFLIAGHRTNIAYNFFAGVDADFFKSKLELSYTLVEYYRNNQDETVLLRLPDEKKQIILQEIEKISKNVIHLNLKK